MILAWNLTHAKIRQYSTSIKKIYSHYCKITQQKIVGKLFFVIKPKLKLFLENRGHPFLDIDQSKISDEPHWILTVGTIGSLEGIARLDTIWEQFAWYIFKKFLWKMYRNNLWEYEFWGNKKICEVVGIIMTLVVTIN